MRAGTLLRPAPGDTVAGTRAVLLQAARVIEQVGLCQGQGHDLTGQVDVLSALRIAADGEWFTAEACAQLLEQWLVDHGLGTSAASWNDRRTQTAARVCTVLRRVAAAVQP